jgi:hypothetical protein
MMPSAVPPGVERERELVKQLDEVQAAASELNAALPFVNDPTLRTQAEALAKGMATVLAAHRDRPGPSPNVADDLAGLMSAARALHVPAQDAELGRTPTLQGLRSAKGLIIAAVDEALEAARTLGLHPRQAPLVRELPMEVARTDNQGLFQGIVKRLDEVIKRLDELDNAKAEPTVFQQQTGLLNFYIGSMRVEADLAKLHLTLGEQTINFSALLRAIEIIEELTGDFFATVKAWVGRVSGAVIRIADEVRERVRRLAAGTRAAARWIVREQLEVSFDPRDPECDTRVVVYSDDGTWLGKSYRARVRAGSSFAQENVMAYLTKIERLTASQEWQDSSSPDIQLRWVGDTPAVQIPASSIRYVNILHADQKGNRLSVWQTQLPSSLEAFLRDEGTYRFTVSVLGQGVARRTRVLVDWQGRWDKVQVRPYP